MSKIIVEMKSISKTFEATLALDKVFFDCREGEVHGLVGENGAGKSTLVKILAGVHQPDDTGEIILWGKRVSINNPHIAEKLGIGIVFQEPRLIPYLDVAENIFLGREPLSKRGFIDSRSMYSKTVELLDELNFKSINPSTKTCKLSAPEQQAAEIARALALNAKIIIMDEPTSYLDLKETEHLFDIIRSLKSQGITIIYISHRLEELFQIVDRATVLRDGKLVGTLESKEMSKSALIQMMVGRPLSLTFPKKSKYRGEKVLSVKNLVRKGVLQNISFCVYKGEILGIAGLVGSGRTELVRCIFGLDPVDEGEIYINGVRIDDNNPRKAMKYGIALVPEDRKGDGLMASLSVQENVTLPILNRISRFKYVNDKQGKKEVEKVVKELDIRLSNINQEMGSLSGGNQQKVILGKWLLLNPNLVILDEPTHGIDVGVKKEIYYLMRELCNKGVAVMIISSELPEILGMSDRIIIMSEGRIVTKVSSDEATEEKILTFATH